MPEVLSLEEKRIALANIDRTLQRVLSMGNKEPVFVTPTLGVFTLSQIRTEVENDTPAGVYHAKQWLKTDEEIHEIQRQAARNSKPL